MEYKELKRQAWQKILLRGPSGHGKTRTSVKVALNALEYGYDVQYVDTESEGSTTFVNVVESEGYDEDIVEDLDYNQVGSLGELNECIKKEVQSRYDLIVVDTLDHKHTMALRAVTEARKKSDVEWNQYPAIYDTEKQIMEKLSKPEANIICTIDPDSGKEEKPKGAQVNVHGYFGIVVDLTKSGDEWGNIIRNWVGNGDYVSKQHPDLEKRLTMEIVPEYGE